MFNILICGFFDVVFSSSFSVAGRCMQNHLHILVQVVLWFWFRLPALLFLGVVFGVRLTDLCLKALFSLHVNWMGFLDEVGIIRSTSLLCAWCTWDPVYRLLIGIFWLLVAINLLLLWLWWSWFDLFEELGIFAEVERWWTQHLSSIHIVLRFIVFNYMETFLAVGNRYPSIYWWIIYRVYRDSLLYLAIYTLVFGNLHAKWACNVNIVQLAWVLLFRTATQWPYDVGCIWHNCSSLHLLLVR